MRNYIITFLLLALSGCSALPYEEDFACKRKSGYGKCTTVEDAYDEAVTGVEKGRIIRKDGAEEGGEFTETAAKTRFDQTLTEEESAKVAYSSYRTELYKQLQELVEAPKTPVVRSAEQERTLILSYTPNGQRTRLYMPRYIYSINREAEFVLGQYESGDESTGNSIKDLLRSGE